MADENTQGQNGRPDEFSLPAPLCRILDAMGIDGKGASLADAVEIAKLEVATQTLKVQQQMLERLAATGGGADPEPAYTPIRQRDPSKVKDFAVEDWMGLLVAHKGSPTHIAKTLGIPHRNEIYRARYFKIARATYDSFSRFL